MLTSGFIYQPYKWEGGVAGKTTSQSQLRRQNSQEKVGWDCGASGPLAEGPGKVLALSPKRELPLYTVIAIKHH